MNTSTDPALFEAASRANETGMATAVWAAAFPQKTAIYEADGGRTRSFGDLNANANRIGRRLRKAGLKAGDAVALLCTNRIEFAEVMLGVLRVGMRLTPVNWHLTADEIAYIVNDCEAQALFADIRVEGALDAAIQCPMLSLKVIVGGELAGFTTYSDALAELDGSNIADASRGHTMLYTSGTTGRPKGVYKPNAPVLPLDSSYDHEVDVHLCTGPGYHSAPLYADIRKPLSNGVPTVLLDKWNTEQVLALIEQHRVTRSHFVPIMFQRLLALPQAVRGRADTSSLQRVIHGAAPCPPEVKRAMIEWLGPVLNEYYAGSEGGVGFSVNSEDWLRKPGTVGRSPDPGATKILDEEGRETAVGASGLIYMRLADQGVFEYFKDGTKTTSSQRDGYFTIGDIGYLDDDGYLFLTGRSAETIIAGGVNIYPQEIDNQLIKHPAVEDSCTVGVPHEDWGEEVRAVVQLKAGFEPSPALRNELLAFAADHVAKFKVPRALDFAASLPRSAAGKIQRNMVREPYWIGKTRKI